MATSGSTDFSINRDQIVTEAYSLIGVGGDGEVIGSGLMADGARALNLMLKTWSKEPGLRSWLKTEGNFTLVADTQSYVFGSGGTVTYRPLRILSARYRSSGGIDTPMNRLTRQEYFDLPQKDASGPSLNYYYDPGSTSGTFYVWPVLSTISATAETIRFTYERVIEDFDAATDDADVPQEWLEGLVYNLAVRLAPRAEVVVDANFAQVAQMALILKSQLEGADQEDGSLYFQPDYQGMR